MKISAHDGGQRQGKARLRAPFAGACLAAFAFCASAAHAQSLPTGCHDADMVRSTLQEEGQFVLVSAARPIPERPKNIFTSNASGTFGYNIEQGTGSVTGKLCVAVRYTDIRVNKDIDGPTPPWALIGEDTAHNQWIEGQRSRTDERIVFGARVLRPENENEVRGGFMMVTRGKDLSGVEGVKTSGAITVSFDNGEIRPTVLLSNVEPVQPNYTSFANATIPAVDQLGLRLKILTEDSRPRTALANELARKCRNRDFGSCGALAIYYDVNDSLSSSSRNAPLDRKRSIELYKISCQNGEKEICDILKLSLFNHGEP